MLEQRILDSWFLCFGGTFFRGFRYSKPREVLTTEQKLHKMVENEKL